MFCGTPAPQLSSTVAAASRLRPGIAGTALQGGRVDHSNHDGNVYRTITDGMAFQEAVYYAMRHTDPETTLIISTAGEDADDDSCE